ncbi:MAG: lactate utilization protein B/C [Gemmatimonadetes bacterium]|nr:lactate utilization protein B/C [Gemmatimonadota bacterium]MYE69610.1 lactate utilization protein B/C [Gemmatimonadota bacterium]MYJ67850.1 lactate utilization protein B/C [Gemmatimonadota bacterium]
MRAKTGHADDSAELGSEPPVSTARAGSRERILSRVARATAGRERILHPGGLGTPVAADPVAEFVKRFTDQGGEVVEGEGTQSAAVWLTGFLRGLDEEVTGVAVGADVPAELRPQLPVVAAAHAGAGISVAWAAVAETGSLILPSTGTRAVQLLPPVHIVWVPEGRVFARLEEALRELPDELPATVGLHSAPSKSADIGQTVVTGVHGPGRCIAVLA